MVVLGRDLKALQRVAEPSAVRGEDEVTRPTGEDFEGFLRAV